MEFAPEISFEGMKRTSLVPILLLDQAGIIRFANACMGQLLHQEEEALIGQRLQHFIIADEVETFSSVFQNFLNNPGEPLKCNTILNSSSGKLLYMSWEFSMLSPEGVQATEILCLGKDCSEAVSMRLKHEELSHKIERIIDSITDGFYHLDKQWRFTSVNKVFEEVVGMPRQELIGKCLWDLFPGSDDYAYPAVYRKAMQEGQSQHFVDYRPDLKRWFSANVYPSSEGLSVYFKDITAQKLAQEQLIASEHKHRAIINSSTESMLLINADFKILLYNTVAEHDIKRFYGRSVQLGDDIRDFVVADTADGFYENFYKALSGERIKMKRKIPFSNDHQVWFEFKYYPVYDPAGELIGIAFISNNIDQQQRQHEQLNEIAMIHSHEIRRPVATILGITSLIKDQELNQANRLWFHYLRETTRQLDAVIHKIVQRATN